MIRFWNLSELARFELKEDFCKELFDRASDKNMHLLAEKLGITYSYTCQLRRGCYSIPKNILIRLSELSNITRDEIEKNILSVRTRHGHKSKIKFPIIPSEKIASLVGHVYGDGFISHKKRQFEYSNTNKNLIKDVEVFIKSIFGIEPITKKQNRITYPSVIGEILICFGAPTSPKTLNYSELPKWIKHGEKSFKKAFLKAVFDDDGSVMFSKNYNAKGINLHWTSHESKKETMENLFNQIKVILEEFEIYCNKPLIARKYIKGNENHIVRYINITDYSSILNFYQKIGFAEGMKKSKLKQIIARGNKYNKRDSINLENAIMKLLKNGKMTTSSLAERLNLPVQKILKKLIRLEKGNTIMKAGRIAANRSYIWKEVTNL